MSLDEPGHRHLDEPSHAWETLSRCCYTLIAGLLLGSNIFKRVPTWCLQVEVTTLDVADLDETRQIMCLADSLAPVGGVFHLAMILQDRWLANQVRPHHSAHTMLHPLLKP